MFFIPIKDVEEKKDRNEPMEEKFREIDETIIKSNDIFKQLQDRSSKFAKDINKYSEKKRNASLASITPTKKN